jgi:predicted alpha/beta-hydrolase family hydrolase
VPEPERFEVISRGDVVPGLLWRDAQASAPSLVLIAPALGAGKDAREVAALARACAAAGWSVAAIDLPLHGERASAKLSARLAGPPHDEADRLLREEFVRQAALDLGAARAALGARTGAERVACVACAPSADAAESYAARAPGVDVVPCEAGAALAEIVTRLRVALAR